MRSLTLYPCARSSPRRQHASHRRRLATAESLERRDLLAAFPAWTPMDPLGGLVYGSSLEPQVLTAGATDQHTLQLPTDQALSVVITPTDGSLQATVELRAPDDQLIASASASAAGEPVALQDVRLGPAGSYEIVIGGANATGGGYAVRAAMNATLEVVDATTADPLAMDGSRTSATLGRYGALGQITPVIDDVVEYREDFDGPTNEFVVDNSTGSGNGLWHVSTVRQADGLPGHSPPQAFYFGQGESSAAGGNYNVGATGGALISPRVLLPEMRSSTVRFSHFLETEGSTAWDIVEVLVDAGAGFIPIASSRDGTLPTGTNGAWETVEFDLSPLAGSEVAVQFRFETIDGSLNDFEGWMIDDFEIISSGFTSEVDDLTLDLSNFAGSRVDILVGGPVGVDLSDAQLELYGTDPLTPLAVGSSAPLGVPATSFGVGILDFVVAGGENYTIRVTHDVPGDYAVVVGENVALDAEPNDSASDPLRSLDPDRFQALGYVAPPTSSVPFGQVSTWQLPVLQPGKEHLLGANSPAALAFLPVETSPAQFAAEYGTRFPVTRVEPDVNGPQRIPQPEVEPNDDFANANELLLGFDTSAGETPEIEVSGTIGANVTTATATEDDNAIPQANLTGLTTDTVYRADGTIQSITVPGQPARADYDWFQIPGVNVGESIFVDIDAATIGSNLDSVVGIYNSAGARLAVNDDANGVDSFLAYTAPFPGDYYVVVRGFGPNSDFQPDPFDPFSATAPGSVGNYEITIGRDIFDAQDTFRLPLEAGDVLGVGLGGNVDRISLFDSAGQLLLEASQKVSSIYPDNSPLKSIPGNNALLGWVIDTTDDYFVRIDQGAGNYEANFRVFRPPLEAAPDGDEQILFLDFDGEQVDGSIWGGNSNAILSPLAAFLPRWGLDPVDDLDPVIDAIVDVVEENLSHDVRAMGHNGDFDASGIQGEFDITILNSRDHADPFGQPNVSRVIVGGTIEQLGIGTIGIAESIDVGNFNTEESAVVLLDLLSASSGNPNSLNQYVLAVGTDIIDMVGIGVGNITAHEAGHFFGNWHTDQNNTQNNIMDQGGNLANTIGLRGLVFGDGDERDVDFVDDVFVPNEGWVGTEHSLQVISFGLPTGGVIRGPIVTSIDPGPGVNPNLYVDDLTINFSRPLDPAAAVDPQNYDFRGAGPDGILDTSDDVSPLFTLNFDGDRQVELELDSAFDPLPIDHYELILKATIVDVLGRQLNQRAGELVGFNTTHAFSIALPTVGDRYAVELMTGDEVSISVAALLTDPTVGVSHLDAELLVYDPSGQLVANVAGDPDPVLSLESLTDGIYHIQVVASSGQGPYLLAVDFSSIVAAGDFDGDGDFDCDDVNALTSEIATGGANPQRFDLNSDNLVNRDDLTVWLEIAGSANLGPGLVYLTGDANLDGMVDGSDFSAWSANKFTLQAAWCLGDFNADGSVDGSDFSSWNSNKFRSSFPTASSVPAFGWPTLAPPAAVRFAKVADAVFGAEPDREYGWL